MGYSPVDTGGVRVHAVEKLTGIPRGVLEPDLCPPSGRGSFILTGAPINLLSCNRFPLSHCLRWRDGLQSQAERLVVESVPAAACVVGKKPELKFNPSVDRAVE